MTTDATRRTFLKFAPVAAAAAAAAAALPVTAHAASPERTAWDAAFRAFEQAEAEDRAFAGTFNALHDRWRTAVNAVPHVTLRPDPCSGNPKPISTNDDFFVFRARRMIADIDAGKCRLDPIPRLLDHEQLCREVVAAADQRNARIEQISKSMGYDVAETRSEELCLAADAARWTLIAMPAPDLAALHWKLSYILEDDGTDSTPAWSSRLIDQTRADMRRLLAGEA